MSIFYFSCCHLLSGVEKDHIYVCLEVKIKEQNDLLKLDFGQGSISMIYCNPHSIPPYNEPIRSYLFRFLIVA